VSENLKCKGCNFRFEKNLDTKGELCDKCYLGIDEAPDEVIITLEMHVKRKRSSVHETAEYIEQFACYTNDIESYDIKFRRIQEGKK
jgi:hypothetical protein